MKRLFFDDDPKRHEHFTMNHIGEDIVHVYNVPEACKALEEQGPFGMVHLDCDMDKLPAPLKWDDGIMVAEFIRDHLPPEKRPQRVHIHSWNEHGRRRMREILDEAKIYVAVSEYPI